MKTFLIILTSVFLFSSCGINSALVFNQNSQNTVLELGEKNFKIVDKVKGESSATYILGFGGLKNKNLIEKAKSEMYDKALLQGSSRAIINQTYERHITNIYPFYYKINFTVSGFVIEFQ
jgi:hypothetical protein